MGTAISDRDIFTLGYATRFHPDIVGIWSAETHDALTLAAEMRSPAAAEMVAQEDHRQGGQLNAAVIVDSALALERSGDRAASLELLECHRSVDTDVQGTLAGRYKRLWLESEDREHAQRALDLYSEALEGAKGKNDSEQIYYLAINVAFLCFVVFDDHDGAKAAARLAKAHALRANDHEKHWNLATQAEAELYLGRPDDALRLYEGAKNTDVEDCQLASTALQAGQVAIKCGNQELAEKLDELFTPAASQIRLVFVSHAHEDEEWMTQLQKFIKPYMRSDETLPTKEVLVASVSMADDWAVSNEWAATEPAHLNVPADVVPPDRWPFVQEELRPAVEALLATRLPWQVHRRTQVELERQIGDAPAAAGAQDLVSEVSPEMFEMFDATLLAGRSFGPSDRLGAEPAMVNASFVRRFYGSRRPVDTRFRAVTGEAPSGWLRIVGVIADLPLNPGSGQTDGYYIPFAQRRANRFTLALHVTGDPLAMTKAVKDTVAQ